MKINFGAACVLLASCAITNIEETMPELDYLWLEEIESRASLDWVRKRNSLSLARLEGDRRYETLRQAAIDNYTADDRIPYVTHVKGQAHNFWQDGEHVKGIWRQTTLESYATDSPDWQTVLDIDALAQEENEDWVYKGRTCLRPDYHLCLIHLSRGGSDAVEIREFDVHAGSFVANGFYLPVAKTQVAWLDEHYLLVATDFGPHSLTTSGYPRMIKKWRRGTKLEDAELLFTASETDMAVSPVTIHREEGSYSFLSRRPEFFLEENHYLAPDGQLQKVPLPEDAEFKGVFLDKLVASLRTDWLVDGHTFKAGSLICIDFKASLNQGKAINPQTILGSTDKRAIKGVVLGQDLIYVSLMEDVDGVLLELRPSRELGWIEKKVVLPAKGSINLVTNDPIGDLTMFNYESFLTPSRLYLMSQGGEPEVIKLLPEKFLSDQYVSEQYFATSRDGTRVPYYVVSSKDLVRDGNAPAYLYAYGGFEVSLTPDYLSVMGIEWLKAGGVFVQANLRGGGEYGPSWHKAALKENRQRAFDDFIAVAEDLIDRKITSPRRLAIRGGSNGGLLVTAVMVQRPELFGAVICAVPLIDMLRYHKLSAGASWMAEYGNPDIPEEAAYIEQYSPWQNVRVDATYPEVFFWTNTKDDRVHPSHARRMVAKMLSQGHKVLYYENTEGGHGGGADPLAQAHTTALELVFLMQTLMD